MSARQACLAELLGTTALLCAVIGSGIMAEDLAGGNVAVALLANTLATVFALYVLIETLGPVSGAHFNPAVTLVMAVRGVLPPTIAGVYVVAQLIGAALGAWLAHAKPAWLNCSAPPPCCARSSARESWPRTWRAVT